MILFVLFNKYKVFPENYYLKLFKISKMIQYAE